MARKPRKRISLSFSDGHRLAPAFVALGLGEVPAAAQLRTLLELGLAAKAAGFHAGVGADGTFKLLQPVEATAESPRPTPVVVAAQPPVGNLPTQVAASERDNSEGPKVVPEAADRARVAPRPEKGDGAAEGRRDVSEAGVREDAEEESPIDDATRQLLTSALQF